MYIHNKVKKALVFVLAAVMAMTFASVGAWAEPGDTTPDDTTQGSAGVDISGLLELLTAANNALSGASVGEGHGQYPADACGAFTLAIDLASVIAEASVTQGEVDDAIADLTAALTAFEAAMIVVDFGKLNTSLTIARALTRGNVSTTVWNALQVAVIDADKALATQYVTQITVDETEFKLSVAIMRVQNELITGGSGGGGSGGGGALPVNPTPAPPAGNGGPIALPRGAEMTLPPGAVVGDDGRVTIPSGSGGAVVKFKNGVTLRVEAGTELILDDAAPLGYHVDFKNPFTDLAENAWHYGDVAFARSHGLFSGTGATTFGADGRMSRGMLVTVLHRLSGEPATDGAAPFSDVDAAQYYSGAIAWASANGIVDGIGGGRFAPDMDITREDLAVVLHRYEQLTGTAPTDATTPPEFADSAAVSDYARAAVNALTAQGVVSGMPGGLFSPKANATRAQVAAMIHRYILGVTAA